MKLKQAALKYPEFLTEFSGFIAVSLIFLFGIGRFRSVLVYAAYCLFKAFSTKIKIDERINLFFLPAVVYTLVLDITKGPISPLFQNNSLIIALPLMCVLDQIFRNLIKRFICRLSGNQYFIICPSCSFDNQNNVQNCTNCTYNINDPLTAATPKISPGMFGSPVPPAVLGMVSLSENEEILFHKKINAYLTVIKNCQKQLRKHFIITTSNIIFLDYMPIRLGTSTGWRERDIIPLSEVRAVEGLMIKRHLSLQPFLKIETSSNDTYELSFSHYGRYMDEINTIANLFTQLNPQVETNVNLSEMPWKILLRKYE